jgi:hypothetical protein
MMGKETCRNEGFPSTRTTVVARSAGDLNRRHRHTARRPNRGQLASGDRPRQLRLRHALDAQDDAIVDLSAREEQSCSGSKICANAYHGRAWPYRLILDALGANTHLQLV